MNIEELEREMPIKTKVEDAAEMMGITPPLLREMLLQDKFPFGTAIKLNQSYSYINTRRFLKYMKAE